MSEQTLFSNPPSTLDVTIYGNAEQITPTLSKSRVRIFYKGMNRNRTFISDEFANQLIDSLPYTPIKGIFDSNSLDFEDHGEDNTDGRIYGIVPENPNVSWEDFQDTDGVTRCYVCCDVYLFTGLYPEAKLVPGKSQSMEIYRKTLQGEWRLNEEDKQPYYHFISGSLVGLQALGDDVEPCFEGAAFFSTIKDLDNLVTYLRNFVKKEEKIQMDKALFRLSDDEKADILFELLNPNFNEEGNWQLNNIVTKVYDDYALCVNSTGYSRVYYTKNEDTVTLGEIIPVRIVDVTETEFQALEAMKAIGTYEVILENYNTAIAKAENLEIATTDFETKKNELETRNSEFESQINNLTEEKSNFEQQIANLNTELEQLKAEKVEFESTISDIKNENTMLSDFKKNIETEQKKDILTKYEEHLSDEIITQLQNSIDTYSVEDFKKEVCTAAVENDPAIFSKKEEEPHLIYTGNSDKIFGSGALALLNKRKNGGNK